ncbi:MAG: hypothetical protein ACREGH_01055 [Minisyncoccia bacterium]
MKIEVIETPRGNRFLWIQQVGGTQITDEEHTAQVLHAPGCAVSEPVVIKRNGEEIASGTMCWIGTQGDHPCFYQLGGVFGEYCRPLNACDMKPCDEIIISPLEGKSPSTFFERTLWAEFTILSFLGGNRPSLYGE